MKRHAHPLLTSSQILKEWGLYSRVKNASELALRIDTSNGRHAYFALVGKWAEVTGFMNLAPNLPKRQNTRRAFLQRATAERYSWDVAARYARLCRVFWKPFTKRYQRKVVGNLLRKFDQRFGRGAYATVGKYA